MEPEFDAEAWLAGLTFQDARDGSHAYVLARLLSPDDQTGLMRFRTKIALEGRDAWFAGRRYRYLDVGRWTYWYMIDGVLNRRRRWIGP